MVQMGAVCQPERPEGHPVTGGLPPFGQRGKEPVQRGAEPRDPHPVQCGPDHHAPVKPGNIRYPVGKPRRYQRPGQPQSGRTAVAERRQPFHRTGQGELSAHPEGQHRDSPFRYGQGCRLYARPKAFRHLRGIRAGISAPGGQCHRAPATPCP